MQLNNTIRNTQAGNVFVFILAGIFLFGALIFTFTRGASKGTTSLSKHQARVAAQEILNYAQSMEQAVNRVRRNGCSENQINFDNSILSPDYNNTNAPSDGSCDIFGQNGGKITLPSYSSDVYFNVPTNYYLFSGGVRVLGVETNELDLIMFSIMKSQEVCNQVNKFLNRDISNTIDIFSLGGGTFVGNFSATGIPDIGDENADLVALSNGCFYVGANTYMFFSVLLAR